MANKKKEYYKPKPMTDGKRNITQGLLRYCGTVNSYAQICQQTQ